MKKLVLIILVLALFTLPIFAMEYNGFINGKMYLKLEEDQKLFYIMGMSDTLDVSMQEAGYDKYFEVTQNILIGEYREMFDDYLLENPKLLDETAAYGFFETITIKLIMELD